MFFGTVGLYKLGFTVADEGLPFGGGGGLVPLFPSKIALCSHVPTLSQNVFVL